MPNKSKAKTPAFDTRANVQIRSVDAANRTVTGYASTASMDAHGTIIEPTAFTKTMPGFMENPVILAAHVHWYESSEPPVIGRVIDWKIDEVGLLVTIEFAQTRIADEYWQLYMSGFMRAFSVGFRVLAREMRPREDGTGEFEVYTEVELIEISCVAKGSNRESLVTNSDGGEASADVEAAEVVVRSMTTAMIDGSSRQMVLESKRSSREVYRESIDCMRRLDHRISECDDTLCALRLRIDELERDRDLRLAGPDRLTEQLDTAIDSRESIGGFF